MGCHPTKNDSLLGMGNVATVCLVPCAGTDDDTGETPDWCETISLKRLAHFDWAVFTNLQGRVPTLYGKVLAIPNGDIETWKTWNSSLPK